LNPNAADFLAGRLEGRREWVEHTSERVLKGWSVDITDDSLDEMLLGGASLQFKIRMDYGVVVALYFRSERGRRSFAFGLSSPEADHLANLLHAALVKGEWLKR
jgi:hypothetical protein